MITAGIWFGIKFTDWFHMSNYYILASIRVSLKNLAKTK